MPRKSSRRRDEPSGRVPQGPRPLALERERFFTLLAAGMSVQQASAAVGINGRTGRDWRRGVQKSSAVKGSRIYPGRPLPPRLVNYGPSQVIDARFLSEDERVQIADLHLAGVGIRAIGRELGRAPSTISRELARNSDPKGGHYRPHAAQRRAWQRRARPKVSKLAAEPALRERVQHYLGELKWSPEQISAQLRRDRPDDPTMNVSHETIYQALYLQGRRAAPGTGPLPAHRTSRRKPRRQPDQRQPRFVDPMLMISERPAEVTDRAVPATGKATSSWAPAGSQRSARSWSARPGSSCSCTYRSITAARPCATA